MNFPDPWPKKRHRERRMLQPSFIKTLGAVLEMKGRFELITDQSWFAQDSYSIELLLKRKKIIKYQEFWRILRYLMLF